MKNKLLAELIKENKLKLVESSEEIKDSYLEKSQSNLDSAKILLENNKLEESVSLTYYSMYNIATSLFFKTGIKCENHSALIILLKEIFEIDNSSISYAKKERIDKQYYADFEITKEEVNEAIKSAEDFSSILIDFISKMNNSDIEEYREKFKEIIS